jgi:hypothetical protein
MGALPRGIVVVEGFDEAETFENVVGDDVFDLDRDEHAALKKRDAELNRVIEATKHLPPESRNAHIRAHNQLRACVGEGDVERDDDVPTYNAVKMTQGGYQVATLGRVKRRRGGLRSNRKLKSA